VLKIANLTKDISGNRLLSVWISSHNSETKRDLWKSGTESNELIMAHLLDPTVLQTEARENWNNYYYFQVYVRILSQQILAELTERRTSLELFHQSLRPRPGQGTVQPAVDDPASAGGWTRWPTEVLSKPYCHRKSGNKPRNTNVVLKGRHSLLRRRMHGG